MVATHSHVFHRKHRFSKPTISHGQGIYLWDTSGKQYIDASGGAVVVNVGHGVKEIADAMQKQAADVAYAHATMFTSRPLEDLADCLATYLPIEDARIFFMASGSEATETAMKVARQIQVAKGEPSRYKTISRWGSYHGATMGALAISGKPSMRALYSPMFAEMPHISPPYLYRGPYEDDPQRHGLWAADALAEEIERQGPETVAAFIAEPIGGATLGAVVPPENYWPRVREICDQYGVLLIADEVMTGIGRTGKWFGIQHWDVSPDVMCLGKGISGGYTPLSATAVRGDLVDLLFEKTGDFNHGGTFSHQPVAAAAGLAAMRYLEANQLIPHAAQMGEVMSQGLHEVFDDHPHVGDIRGRGLMWAVELVKDRTTREPFPPKDHLSSVIFKRAFESGLITYAVSGCADGTSGDHVMISPPLVVTEPEIAKIIAKLDGAIQATL